MPAFSTPATWADGELVDATKMNTEVRDNITNLDDWRGEIGYVAVTSDGSNFTTSETQVTSVAVTVPTGGRNLKITAHCTVSGTVNDDRCRIRLYHGSTRIAERDFKVTTATTNPEWGQVLVGRVAAPASGSQTFSLKAFRVTGSGTLTFRASSVNPTFILVEGL